MCSVCPRKHDNQQTQKKWTTSWKFQKENVRNLVAYVLSMLHQQSRALTAQKSTKTTKP